jgi:hypothetical protein
MQQSPLTPTRGFAHGPHFSKAPRPLTCSCYCNVQDDCYLGFLAIQQITFCHFSSVQNIEHILNQ